MKATIDVSSRKEGEQLRKGLEDPSVRAFVQIIAALRELPNDRVRVRVLRFVGEAFEDQAQVRLDDDRPLTLVTGG